MILHAKPLTQAGFAPYGDVIETAGAPHFPINSGRIERFHDLARVETAGARALVSIFKCNRVSTLPHRVELLERHRLGSQAFIPLNRARMIVVVGVPGESVVAEQLVAFITNGSQGVNYRPGVWHMPLIALDPDHEFLVVDRGDGDDCDEALLPDVVVDAEERSGTP